MCIKLGTAFLILIIALLIPYSRVEAVGIGVIPSKLELEASPLSSDTSPVNVINSSDEEALYQVYIEGDYNSWFSITPSEFTLGPQESQEIMISLSPPITATGEHDVSICIIGLAPASDLKIGCGVKIPTHVKIIAPLSVIGVDVTGPPLIGIIVGTLVAIISVSVIVVRRRRKFYEVEEVNPANFNDSSANYDM